MPDKSPPAAPEPVPDGIVPGASLAAVIELSAIFEASA